MSPAAGHVSASPLGLENLHFVGHAAVPGGQVLSEGEVEPEGVEREQQQPQITEMERVEAGFQVEHPADDGHGDQDRGDYPGRSPFPSVLSVCLQRVSIH